MLDVMRAISVIPAGKWPAGTEIATVTLTFDDRFRRRLRLTLDDGKGEFLLDLKLPVRLNEDDGLVLENGGIIRVIAAAEPLLEIRADSSRSLARFAYHLGNRHLPVELLDHALFIRQDHVIQAMMTGLGAECAKVDRAFSPEPGAYGGGHDHHHEHDHKSHQ